jgi:hypothetical protein
MKIASLPAFITEKRTIKRKGPPARYRRAAKAAARFDGDTGTPEMKRQLGAILEPRERTSTGHVVTVGARVESQYPHDRYRVRKQLDPKDPTRNDMMWHAAERLRQDFYLSGLQAKQSSSFQPRVSGGEAWSQEQQAMALGRYKRAMNGVGVTLRACLFFVCIEGWAADAWARKNGKKDSDGIALLRAGLEELAALYGYIKNPIDNCHGYAS